MKTIFKILVILALAVLVGGLFYGVVTATSSTDQTSMPEKPVDGEFPADGELAHPDREDTGGIQNPADAIKNLVIISFVSVIYLNVTKWLSRKRSTLEVAP